MILKYTASLQWFVYWLHGLHDYCNHKPRPLETWILILLIRWTIVYNQSLENTIWQRRKMPENCTIYYINMYMHCLWIELWVPLHTRHVGQSLPSFVCVTLILWWQMTLPFTCTSAFRSWISTTSSQLIKLYFYQECMFWRSNIRRSFFNGLSQICYTNSLIHKCRKILQGSTNYQS